MKHYQVICQSVRGESHIRRNTPKEDAAAVVRLDDRIIGTVSDGHGDPRCMRSQVGSQLAVDAAVEMLRDWEIEGACDDQHLESRIRELSRGIVDRWTRAVEAHFAENPLTDAELNDAGNLRASYLQGRYISHIYGATLLALLRWDDRLLLLQKGDGHAVVIDKRGCIDDQVIPWDDRCYLNVTTSLCDSDAADTFTYRLLRGEAVEDIAAVMLGSDGVEDSFSNSDLMGAYYGLLATECVENGEAATEEAMLRDLSEMSRYGSKDDISVVGLIDPEAIPPLKPVFERIQKRGTLALKLEKCTARLGSMSAAYARREQQMQAKQQALEAFRSKTAEIAAGRDTPDEDHGVLNQMKLGKLERDLEMLQRRINQRNDEELRLRKQVSASAEEYKKRERERSSARLKYARLLDSLEQFDGNPLSFLWKDNDLWMLESLKDHYLDTDEAFSEQERLLRHAEQDLEDWQKKTQAMELRRKKLTDEIEEARRAQNSRTGRRSIEAEIEQRGGEESRLEREAAEIRADFEAYCDKYEAAKRERDQLAAEIEQMKESAPIAHPSDT